MFAFSDGILLESVEVVNEEDLGIFEWMLGTAPTSALTNAAGGLKLLTDGLDNTARFFSRYGSDNLLYDFLFKLWGSLRRQVSGHQYCTSMHNLGSNNQLVYFL